MNSVSSSSHVGIFWDIENCGVPSATNSGEVARKIRTFAQQFGQLQFIKAYGNLKLLNKKVLDNLHDTGVELCEVPTQLKNATDITILLDMCLYLHDSKGQSPPAKIVLISGDKDFSRALNKFMQRGYDVIVVHMKNASDILRGSAVQTHTWEEVLGVERGNNQQQQPATPSATQQQQQKMQGQSQHNKFGSKIQTGTATSNGRGDNKVVRRLAGSTTENNKVPEAGGANGNTANLSSKTQNQEAKQKPEQTKTKKKETDVSQQKYDVKIFDVLVAAMRSLGGDQHKVRLDNLGPVVPYKNLGFKKLIAFATAAQDAGLVVLSGSQDDFYVQLPSSSKAKSNSPQADKPTQNVSSELKKILNKVRPEELVDTVKKVSSEGFCLTHTHVLIHLRLHGKKVSDKLWATILKLVNQPEDSNPFAKLFVADEKLFYLRGQELPDVANTVDMKNPKDRYNANQWKVFYDFVRARFPLLQSQSAENKVSKYQLAQDVQNNGPEELKQLNLAQICEMAQLAINSQNVIVYELGCVQLVDPGDGDTSQNTANVTDHVVSANNNENNISTSPPQFLGQNAHSDFMKISEIIDEDNIEETE